MTPRHADVAFVLECVAGVKALYAIEPGTRASILRLRRSSRSRRRGSRARRRRCACGASRADTATSHACGGIL